MKEIKLGIGRKTLISIIILSISICFASCYSGYRQYKNSIESLYNEKGYAIGDLILYELDHEIVAEYSKTFEADAQYGPIKEYLDGVLNSTGVKYIYIVVPLSDGNMRYIYDSSGMTIGSIDPISKFHEEIMQVYTSGEQNRDNYFIRNSKKYGRLTSSILPIKDKAGDTVALLFVDIAMEDIEANLNEFIFKAIVISFVLMLIFCQICYLYMKKAFTIPVKVIEKCLTDFAENNAQLTHELESIKTNDELQLLAETLFSMEKSVVDYIDRITSITAEKERNVFELNLARDIQASMLPCKFPPFPERKEFDIYASMTPAKEVGGDFYDFFLIDDSHVGIVMADVSGKGVPAALFMAVSKILLKNRMQISQASPAEILKKVNNQLCENNKVEMFVTVWLGILDINTGIITAANAGHEFPCVKHNGRYELIKDKHGFVLAGMENLNYKDYEIKLEKGDSLFLYTDGVTEATNTNNELFGTDRMIEALNSAPDEDCKAILDSVQSAIDGFVKDAPQFDDITMLCLEYNGGTV